MDQEQISLVGKAVCYLYVQYRKIKSTDARLKKIESDIEKLKKMIERKAA